MRRLRKWQVKHPIFTGFLCGPLDVPLPKPFSFGDLMEQGYIKVWRKLVDSEVFQDPHLLQLFLYIALRAAHKKKFASLFIGNSTVSVKVDVGQFIFGRFKVAEKLGCNPNTLYKRIKKLVSMEMISIDSNNKYSIITVCNWKEYQVANEGEVTTKEQQGNNKVTTREQQSNTNKNYKNVKNNKNNKKDITTRVFNPVNIKPEFIDEKDWNDLILHRKKHKNKPVQSERAYKSIIRELEKTTKRGYTAAECIDEMVSRNWQTFKDEWMPENTEYENIHGTLGLKWVDKEERKIQ